MALGPTEIKPVTAAPAAAVSLTSALAGRAIEARLTLALTDGLFRFSSAEGEFDLALPQALPPGTRVSIAAQPGGALEVTVLGEDGAAAHNVAALRSGAPVPPGAPVTELARSETERPPAVTASLAGARSISVQPGPAVPSFPSGQTVEARVLYAPVNAATTFSSAAGNFELELPSALAVGTVVRVLPQANGGLTLVPQTEAPQPAAGISAPSASSPAEALKLAGRAAAARQDGLAHLFADLDAVATHAAAPQAVRTAAGSLLAQRLPLRAVAEPAALANAIAKSGLLAERVLAGLTPGAAQAPPDLKLALFVLRGALGAWTSGHSTGARAEAHLPPPAPGMPPAAQTPQEPSALVGQGIAAEEFAPRLMHETEAALARVSLHQIASLPDDQPLHDAPDARWSCEVPVNVDGRTAMFGFIIERDGRQARAEQEKKRWRVRAAIDLMETGSVEADVRLRGDAVTAGLLVERAETADALEAALPMLRDGLTAAGFQVEALSVRLGKAVAEPSPPGHFVDLAT